MHLNGRPVASFDPEGLIFAAGIDSRQLKLYDLRSFDKVQLFNEWLSFWYFLGSVLYFPCETRFCWL